MILGYLDAGTGSLVLQMLVGGIGGLVVFVRYRWGTIRRWMQRGDEAE